MSAGDLTAAKAFALPAAEAVSQATGVGFAQWSNFKPAALNTTASIGEGPPRAADL